MTKFEVTADDERIYFRSPDYPGEDFALTRDMQEQGYNLFKVLQAALKNYDDRSSTE